MWGTRSVSEYEILSQIGLGTYGYVSSLSHMELIPRSEVFKARNRQDGSLVALKKIKVHKVREGVSSLLPL